MKILLVGYVKGHQATRFSEEAKKIGVEVVGVHTSALCLNFINGEFTYYLRGVQTKLEEFDLIYLGVSGNKTRWEWYTMCEYLQNHHGTAIVNSKYIDSTQSVYWTSALDYLRQTENNLPFPDSSYIFNKNSLKEVKDKVKFPLIVKIVAPGLTRKGKGVNKVDSWGDLVTLVDETKGYADKYILRQFIENDGDIRVFTVGYKAIGAMKRTPKTGDFKSNISQGGSGEGYDLTKNPQVAKIAEDLSRVMSTEIGGVDIILDKNTGKPYILEINPNPQFVGFEEYTDVNAAKAIIEYFVSLVSI